MQIYRMKYEVYANFSMMYLYKYSRPKMFLTLVFKPVFGGPLSL